MSTNDFDHAPVNQWLGFQMKERSKERVVIEQHVRPEMLQETGVVQGGLLTALADTAAVYLLWPDLDGSQSMAGTSVSMQFLAAARHGDDVLVATSTPLRIGRTIAVCESVVTQGARRICKGTFTFLLTRKP